MTDLSRLRDCAGAAVLAYETVAIVTRKLPTLTHISYALRDAPLPAYLASVATVVAGVGYLAFHLLLDGWDS